MQASGRQHVGSARRLHMMGRGLWRNTTLYLTRSITSQSGPWLSPSAAGATVSAGAGACVTLRTPSGGSIFSTLPTRRCVVEMKSVAFFEDSSSSSLPNLTASTGSTDSSPFRKIGGTCLFSKRASSRDVSPAGFAAGTDRSPWISTMVRPWAVETSVLNLPDADADADAEAVAAGIAIVGVKLILVAGIGAVWVCVQPVCSIAGTSYSLYTFLRPSSFDAAEEHGRRKREARRREKGEGGRRGGGCSTESLHTNNRRVDASTGATGPSRATRAEPHRTEAHPEPPRAPSLPLVFPELPRGAEPRAPPRRAAPKKAPGARAQRQHKNRTTFFFFPRCLWRPTPFHRVCVCK